MFAKYAKAILAAIGGLSPAVVVGVLALFKVDLDANTVAAILGVLSPILATLGVAVGPANKSDAEIHPVDPLIAEDVDRGAPPA